MLLLQQKTNSCPTQKVATRSVSITFIVKVHGCNYKQCSLKIQNLYLKNIELYQPYINFFIFSMECNQLNILFTKHYIYSTNNEPETSSL